MRYIIIKVGETHHGALVPGTLIAVPHDRVSFHGLVGVSFQNPTRLGGWSVGQKVGEIDLDIGEKS